MDVPIWPNCARGPHSQHRKQELRNTKSICFSHILSKNKVNTQKTICRPPAKCVCLWLGDGVKKYCKYGLYNKGGLLSGKWCDTKGDHEPEDNIKIHITTDLHDLNYERRMSCAAPFVSGTGV